MANALRTKVVTVVDSLLNRLTPTRETSLLIPLFLTSLSASGQVGTAVRQLPFDFHPGDLIEVRLLVTPPPGTTNWTVHEGYPDPWDFVSSTNASSTNAFSGQLGFGPFTNDAATTLVYEVASLQGLTNSVLFTGSVTFDGLTQPMAGTAFLPARNEWLFVGPQSLDQGYVAGLAYGANRWLASSFGWTTSLEPGGRLTYPRGLPYCPDGWSRLAYIGGLFLRFGTDAYTQPTMMISDDGLSWKFAQPVLGDAHPDPFLPGQGFLRSVAYGHGVYVAVGDQSYAGEPSQGAIFNSTNGYNWRRVFRLPYSSTNATERVIHAVAFADDIFMAVADRGTLLTSTNGSDWAELQPLTDPGNTNDVWMARDLHGICHGPAGWIIPSSFAGATLRSTDGATWTELDGTGSSFSSTFWQSFYADGKYWFSDFTQAYTTADGTSWTRLPSISSVYPVGPVSRAPDGVDPQYLGTGANNSSVVGSTDGNTWAYVIPGAISPWPRYLSVLTVSNECVVTGQETYRTGLNGPYDRGTNVWPPLLQASVVAVRAGNAQWRNGLQDALRAYADLLSTTNGILAAGGSRDTYGGRLWADILAGTNYSVTVSSLLPALSRQVGEQPYKFNVPRYYDQEYVRASLAPTPFGYELLAEVYSYWDYSRVHWGHFSSSDGTNWLRRAIGLNDVTNFPGMRGIAWGAGRFVAVSEGAAPGASFDTPLTSTNRIYTSTDGQAYTAVDLTGLAPDLQGEGLTGIVWANGRFLAIGNAGRILSSTNGLDWQTVRISDGHPWNRIRYLDGTWSVVGNAGWVGLSTDGQHWTGKTSGTEADLTDITRQNGEYLMVGSHATVLVSLPVTRPVILLASLLKLPGAGLQFTVNGQPGKILDIQSSADLVNWTSLFLKTNSTGTLIIADLAADPGRQFYRAVQQP